jgi:small-conductance mechanosensitive channel
MIRRVFRFLAVTGLVSLLAAAPAPKGPPPNPLANQKDAVLDHLRLAVSWYRQIQAGSQSAAQESDGFFFNSERRLSADILRAAFESSQAEAMLIADSNPQAPSANSQSAARVAAAIAAAETQMRALTVKKNALDAKLTAAQAEGTVPAGLTEQRDVLIAQINLAQARAEVLQKVSSNYSLASDEESNSTLAGIVAALERSVPELESSDVPVEDKAKPVAAAGATSAAASASAAAAAAPANDSNSIIARSGQLYSLVSSRSQIARLQARADLLTAGIAKLQAPLRTSALAIVQGSQQINDQVAQTTDPEQLVTLRHQVEDWTAQYHGLTGALVPLTRELSLLGQSKENLAEWRASLDRQYDRIMSRLLIKTLTVVAMLLLVWGLSEFWRRATFKYVADARRRRQLLLTRRIVTAALMIAIIVIGFISDFSSLATFAGFITAGLAVALQSVILSVAAYFFLIGRYGVKVGDRVTISGVTGEVIDIGLVRVYLMEYAGTGVDLHPTGRVVVFANSALFSSNPLFKQIPGTEFTWHELYMAVKPDADLTYVKTQVAAAVVHVYAEFRPRLEDQHKAVERLIDFRMEVPEPITTMRFTGSGVELVIRYPLELNRGSEVDSKMAHEVLAAIRADDKLTAAISGMPQIRSAIRS